MTDPDTVVIQVPGRPAPGGSKKSFLHSKTGRIVTMDDCRRNGDWKSVVALSGRVSMAGRDPLDGPLVVDIVFTLERPAGHFGSGKNATKLKPSAPSHPTVKPDVSKLARSTEDALTGIVWRDDARIVDQRHRKTYGTNPGAQITVRRLTLLE